MLKHGLYMCLEVLVTFPTTLSSVHTVLVDFDDLRPELGLPPAPLTEELLYLLSTSRFTGAILGFDVCE